MDRLLQNNDVWGGLLLAASALDYLGIATFLILYGVKSFGNGVDTASTIYTAILMIHFFSFGFTFAVATTKTDLNVTLAAIGATLVVFFVDLAVLLLRFLSPIDDSMEMMIINIIHVVWACANLAQFVLLSTFLVWLAKERKQKLKKLLLEKKSYLEVDKIFKVKGAAPYRRYLERLFVLELGLSVIFILLFIPGFVTGAAYSWLALTVLPHLLQWIWALAIVGTDDTGAVSNPNNLLLLILMGMVLPSLVLDALAAIVRVVLLTQTSSSFEFVFALIYTIVSLLFFLIGVFYYATLENLFKKLCDHHSKTLKKKGE